MAEQIEARKTLLLSPSQLLCEPGIYSSVAINSRNDVFIAYHNSHIFRTVCYRLAQYSPPDYQLVLEAEEKLSQCDGTYPKVALSDNKIVVTYTRKRRHISSAIVTIVGSIQLNEKTVSWDVPTDACGGENPSVAVHENKVLLVFSRNKSIFYKTGMLDETKYIKWAPETKLDDGAYYPTASLLENTFIILYQNKSNRLKTITGKVQYNYQDNTHKLICGIAQDHSEGLEASEHCTGEYPSAAMFSEYYSGKYPSVAMFSDHTFIATHQTGIGAFRKLYARCGKVNLDNLTTEWQQNTAAFISYGCLSSVAAVDGHEKSFLEVHCTNEIGKCTLYYEAGCIKTVKHAQT